jgi:hypothetical protein
MASSRDVSISPDFWMSRIINGLAQKMTRQGAANLMPPTDQIATFPRHGEPLTFQAHPH